MLENDEIVPSDPRGEYLKRLDEVVGDLSITELMWVVLHAEKLANRRIAFREINK